MQYYFRNYSTINHAYYPHYNLKKPTPPTFKCETIVEEASKDDAPFETITKLSDRIKKFESELTSEILSTTNIYHQFSKDLSDLGKKFELKEAHEFHALHDIVCKISDLLASKAEEKIKRLWECILIQLNSFQIKYPDDSEFITPFDCDHAFLRLDGFKPTIEVDILEDPTSADLQAIQRILRESFEDLTYKKYCPKTTEDLAKNENRIWIAARLNNEIVGVIKNLFDKFGSLHIEAIGRSLSIGQAGIGRDLMGFIFGPNGNKPNSFLWKTEYAYLGVRETNTKAINLYEKFGFYIENTREFDEGAEISMGKEIK